MLRAAELVDRREALLDGSGTLLKNCASFIEPCGPPSALAPLSEIDHDQRVVELADPLEEVEHPTDVVVGVRQEAREHLHHPRVEPLLVVAQRLPLRHVGVVRESSVFCGTMPSSFWRANTLSRYASQPSSKMPL